jgi:transposase InsO family protein
LKEPQAVLDSTKTTKMSAETKIKKFSGKKDAYKQWRSQIVASMVEREIGYTVGIEIGKLTRKDVDKDVQEIANAKLHSIIILNIDGHVLDQMPDNIRDGTNGRATFKWMDDKYNISNPIENVYWLRRIMHLYLEESSDMETHIQKFKDYVKKSNSGKKILLSEEVCKFILLANLPENYEGYVQRVSMEDNVTFDRVCDDLIAMKFNHRIANDENALTTRFHKTRRPHNPKGNDKKPSPSPKGKPISKCDFCGKLNHTREECRTLKSAADYLKKQNPSNHPQQRSHKDQVHITTLDFNESDEEIEESSLNTEVKDKPHITANFIVDSGATSHMCQDKEIFTTLEPYEKRNSVITANGERLNVMGIGDIVIQTLDKDGRKYRLRLQNVLYIPNLRRNLLSVNDIEAKGNKIKFYNQEIVLKNGRIIPMQKRGKLQYLTGHAIMGETNHDENFTVEIIPSDEDYEAYKVEGIPDVELWHARLGHQSKKAILELHNHDAVLGLDISNTKHQKDCNICDITKMRDKPFKPAEEIAHKPLDIVYTDVSGPIKPTSMNGYTYAISFTDSYSKYIEVYLMKRKSDVLEVMKQYIADCAPIGQPKIIRSDNGPEYEPARKWCQDKGIKIENTIPYTPEQNGQSERNWQSLWAMCRAMLKHSNVNEIFWDYALKTAAQLKNLTIAINAHTLKITPYELYHGKKPDVSKLRTFGCEVYVYKRSPRKTKLEDRSSKGIFLGYSTKAKANFVYIEELEKVIIARAMKFFERPPHIVKSEVNQPQEELTNQTLTRKTKATNATMPIHIPIPRKHVDTVKQSSDNDSDDDVTIIKTIQGPPRPSIMEVKQEPVSPPSSPKRDANPKQTQSSSTPKSPYTVRSLQPSKSPKSTTLPDIPIVSEVQPTVTSTAPEPRRSGRNLRNATKPSGYYKRLHLHGTDTANNEQASKPSDTLSNERSTEKRDTEPAQQQEHSLHTTQSDHNVPLPTSWNEAVRYKEWQDAMTEEYNAQLSCDSWTLSPLPPDRKPVKSKWVYKIKQNADGSIAKHKARLVACGYSQIWGIDYLDTYSPVARPETIKLLIALAARRGHKIRQYDVQTAYLHANLDTEIYMEPPQGFETYDQQGRKLYCKMNKSIYGLKQSGRNWNIKLTNSLIAAGFIQSKADPCLFYIRQRDKYLYIAIYVDDIITVGNDDELREDIFKKLKENIKIQDLGDAHWVLSMEIIYHSQGISISQSKYIQETLEKFNMSECKPVTTPIESIHIEESSEIDNEEKAKYRSIVGSLMYIAVISRPDIQFAVNFAARSNQNPKRANMVHVKRILRYLKGTHNLSITYYREEDDKLKGYCDASWGSEPQDRKSTSGYIFTLAGGPITWYSKKQSCIALSSTAAEYIALSKAVEEAIYLRTLLSELQWDQESATDIYQDNNGSRFMATNEANTKTSKHIEIRYHYSRDMVKKGHVNIRYLETTKMPADMLTKPIKKILLARHINTIGMKIIKTAIDQEEGVTPVHN